MKFIIDRTMEDAQKAHDIVETKIKKFIELTREDEEIISKGVFSLSDILRIINNEREIGENLKTMGYYSQIPDFKDYSEQDEYRSSDLQILLKGALILKKSFLPIQDVPDVDRIGAIFEDINSLEKILSKVDEGSQNVVALYRYSGDTVCGG